MPPTTTASPASRASSHPNTFGGFPGDYYSTGYNAGLRDGRPGQQAPPGPGDLELRVHDRQQSERPVLVVGELVRTLDPHPVAGTAPGDGAGRLSPRLGNVPGQRRAAGLTGGSAHRRRARRGPRGPGADGSGGGPPISVTNFPTTDGRRLSLTDLIERPVGVAHPAAASHRRARCSSSCRRSSTTSRRTSAGRVDQGTGTVTLSPDTKRVSVQLRAAPRA